MPGWVFMIGALPHSRRCATREPRGHFGALRLIALCLGPLRGPPAARRPRFALAHPGCGVLLSGHGDGPHSLDLAVDLRVVGAVRDARVNILLEFAQIA